MITEKSPEIVNFEQELLETFKGYLPQVDYTGRSVYTTSDHELLNIKHRLGAIHSHLQGSEYEYKGPFRFIHYTSSLQRAIEIIQKKAFRISSLNSFNDPQEFNFIARNRHFSNLKPNSLSNETWKKLIESWRKRIFAMSFCKYNDIHDESFEMWRLYGGNGKGVGIVFEIENQNIQNWFGHYLCSVKYGDSEDQQLPINQLLNEIGQLWEKHPYPQIDPSSKFPEILIALLSFHKDSIWKIEDEVRLAVVTTEGTPTYKPISSLSNDDHRSVHHIDLEIFSNVHPDDLVVSSDETMNQIIKSHREWRTSHYPIIRIKELVVGYKHQADTIERFKKCIVENAHENRIPFIHVIQSNLAQKFLPKP
jgi:hypothetical protein